MIWFISSHLIGVFLFSIFGDFSKKMFLLPGGMGIGRRGPGAPDRWRMVPNVYRLVSIIFGCFSPSFKIVIIFWSKWIVINIFSTCFYINSRHVRKSKHRIQRRLSWASIQINTWPVLTIKKLCSNNVMYSVLKIMKSECCIHRKARSKDF